MTLDKRYLAIVMNDGGIPILMNTDNLDDAQEFINGYYQHYLIRDLIEDKMLVISDIPEDENEISSSRQ